MPTELIGSVARTVGMTVSVADFPAPVSREASRPAGGTRVALYRGRKRKKFFTEDPKEVGEMKGRTIAHKILTVSTFLSVLAAMGCGYSPVSPSQDNAAPGVIEDPLFVRVLPTSTGSSGRDMLQTSSTSVSMVIPAETGGTVSNGYVSLYFPPGALDEDTEITIDMPKYPLAIVELGPHGIQFNKNVIMTMPTALLDSDATSYRTLWYNEDAGVWVDIGGRANNEYVETELEHFSSYGLADKL